MRWRCSDRMPPGARGCYCNELWAAQPGDQRRVHRRPSMVLRILLSLLRHEGCGGRAGRAELITGIEGVSSRPVRRIVLLG